MSKNRDRAKQLRNEQAEAEAGVWSQLRGRRFSGCKFRRQVALGNYIVDFVCLDRRVIVERDGGQHNEPNRKAYDSRRDAWLRREGFEVLRFWNSAVFTEWEAMAGGIWNTLGIRPAKRSPSPPTPVTRGARGPCEPSERA